MIKAIFFDFNGVIIDDETIQMKAYQEVLRGHDINLSKNGTLERWEWTTGRLSGRCLKAGKPLTDELVESVLSAKTAIIAR